LLNFPFSAVKKKHLRRPRVSAWKKGKEFLKTTDATVTEIAFRVGFSDPSYFSRMFQKEFGIPPSAIRQA
jgi:transcriptional regulator GlxA family with amidase domain